MQESVDILGQFPVNALNRSQISFSALLLSGRFVSHISVKLKPAKCIQLLLSNASAWDYLLLEV